MPATDTALINLHWADALLAGMVANGVAHAVLSPGSRSTPLVLACNRHEALRTWVRSDERSAAFFALGLARATGMPVALVATSGSAPAHWYPAVVEAAQAGVPLLLLTADRPPELHGWGANQTVDQARLFGTFCRACHEAGPPQEGAAGARFMAALGARAVRDSRWPRPGPVQINLPLREPLVPATLPAPAAPAAPRFALPAPPLPPATEVARLAHTLRGRPGLILAGPGSYSEGFAPALAALAAALGVPVLADPLSGLRFGAHDKTLLLTRYDAWLRRPQPLPAPPAWVLQFGRLPVSRSVEQWLANCAPLEHVLVDASGGWPDPLHRATALVVADPEALCGALLGESLAAAPIEWLAALRGEEARAEALAAQHLAAGPLFEGQVVRALVDALSGGGWLFSGNSLPIRQLDTWSGSGQAPLRILCNRGASGIDGNLSTVLGLAAAGCRPLAGLVGDVAFAHDLGGLLGGAGLDATLVVVNNGGGAIFDTLPQAGLPGFERYWRTPPGLDLSAAAALFGAAFRQVRHPDELAPALAGLDQPRGLAMVEVVVDAAASLARHRAYWADVAA